MKTANKKLTEVMDAPENKVGEKVKTENIRRGYRLVSSVPTTAPRNFYESIVIYVNGATYRLYVYDEVNSAWRYANLT